MSIHLPASTWVLPAASPFESGSIHASRHVPAQLCTPPVAIGATELPSVMLSPARRFTQPFGAFTSPCGIVRGTFSTTRIFPLFCAGVTLSDGQIRLRSSPCAELSSTVIRTPLPHGHGPLLPAPKACASSRLSARVGDDGLVCTDSVR